MVFGGGGVREQSLVSEMFSISVVLWVKPVIKVKSEGEMGLCVCGYLGSIFV